MAVSSFALVPHPDDPPRAVRGVSVEIDGDADAATLTYRIDGNDAVRFPPPGRPERSDDLWRTTCFEIFLKPADGAAYVELNVSPSGRWAAYRFEGRRSGRRDLALAVAPHVERRAAAWIVGVDGAELPATPLAVGVTAVIEELDGTTSYWALAHAPGPPDFHDPDCFIATFPAPTRA